MIFLFFALHICGRVDLFFALHLTLGGKRTASNRPPPPFTILGTPFTKVLLWLQALHCYSLRCDSIKFRTQTQAK